MFTCLVLCLFRVFQAFLTTRIKMETSILSSLSYLIFLRGRALGPALGEGPAIPAPPPCCYCKTHGIQPAIRTIFEWTAQWYETHPYRCAAISTARPHNPSHLVKRTLSTHSPRIPALPSPRPLATTIPRAVFMILMTLSAAH